MLNDTTMTDTLVDAISLRDADYASSDIRNSEFQDRLADSLLDPEGARPMSELLEHFDDAAEERMAEEWPNGEQADFADDGAEFAEVDQPAEVDYTEAREAFRDQQELNEILDDAVAWQAQQQQQQMQPQEVTPAAIQQSMQNLDRFVVENGISDPQAAQGMASALTSAIGIQPTEVNALALDTVLGKVMASSIDVYNVCGGDLTKLGAIHPDMARAFFSEFNSAWHMDARTEGNASQAAEATLVGNFGFLKAVETYGIDAPLHLLNPGQGAEFVVNELAKAYGCTAPIPREVCLKMTDPIIERWRGQLRQVLAVREQEAQPSRQTGRRRSSRMSQEAAHARKVFPGMRVGEYRGMEAEG